MNFHPDGSYASGPKEKPKRSFKGAGRSALVILLAVAAHFGAIGANLWGGVWQLGPWQLHPLVLLFALSGSLMISKTLHIPKP